MNPELPLGALAMYPAQFALVASGALAADAESSANAAPAVASAAVRASAWRKRLITFLSFVPIRKSEFGDHEEVYMTAKVLGMNAGPGR